MPAATPSTSVKSRCWVPWPNSDERESLVDPTEETEDAHVWPSRPSADGEVSERRPIETVVVVIGMG